MKNLLFWCKLIIGVYIGSAFLLSCSKDGEATPAGFPSEEKVIGCDAQEIILKAKKNVDWFLVDFTINGQIIRNEIWESEDIIYYTSREYDPTNKYNHLLSIYKIEYDWFIWEKVDNRTIKIILTENKEDERRSLNFSVSVGNAQDDIKITQETNN